MKTESCDSDTQFIEVLEASSLTCPEETIFWFVDLGIKFPLLIDSIAQVLNNQLKDVATLSDELHPDSLFGAAVNYNVVFFPMDEWVPEVVWHKLHSIVLLIRKTLKGGGGWPSFEKLISSMVSTYRGDWPALGNLAVVNLFLVLENQEAFFEVDWNALHFGYLINFFVYAIADQCLNPEKKEVVLNVIHRIFFSCNRKISKEDVIFARKMLNDQKRLLPLLAYFAKYTDPQLDFVAAAIPVGGLDLYAILMMSSIVETGSPAFRSLDEKVLLIGESEYQTRLEGILKFTTKDELMRMFIFSGRHHKIEFLVMQQIQALLAMKKLQEDMRGDIGAFGFYAGIDWSHLIYSLDYSIRKLMIENNLPIKSSDEIRKINQKSKYQMKSQYNIRYRSVLSEISLSAFHVINCLLFLAERFSVSDFSRQYDIMLKLISDLIVKNKNEVKKEFHQHPDLLKKHHLHLTKLKVDAQEGLVDQSFFSKDIAQLPLMKRMNAFNSHPMKSSNAHLVLRKSISRIIYQEE
jgi:hypothetical protein